MKLVKLFPETADHEDFNSRSIGIFEVKKEDYVIRTYSNGLSFKHIPGIDRWYYKGAVVERVRQLGVQSAKDCQKYAPKIISLFSRWRALKEEFKANHQTDMSLLHDKLKAFAEELALPDDALDSAELYEAIKSVLEYRNPKFLAVKFAELCQDRSNLGQSSFLRLVGAGRAYFDATEKLQWVAEFFHDHPEEFASFLLFGRAPWTEMMLSRRYQCSFFWTRNFIVGIHNKFKFELENTQITLPEPSLLLDLDFYSVLEPFEAEIQKKCEAHEEAGGNSTRIKGFLRALEKLRKQSNLLIEPFRTEEVQLTWKDLKIYANTLRGISFSALRAVFARACLHHELWSHAVERCLRRITPENTLKKPFHERVSLKPLPIDLVMSKKYVIYRPGNAKKMRELIIKEGSIWFEIPKVNLGNTLLKAKACWHAPSRVISALQKGAKIHLFRFLMPQGPGKTIKVSIVLSGAEEWFLGTAHLTQKEDIVMNPSRMIVGLDTNRLSEYIFRAPFDLGLQAIIQEEITAWNHLEQLIGALQKKAEKIGNWKQRVKLKSEIGLLHRRRSNIRNEILKKTRIHLGILFNALDVKFIALEAELHKDTKDKKGGLAKAIASMPDNLSVITREILLINEVFRRELKLILIRKEGRNKSISSWLWRNSRTQRRYGNMWNLRSHRQFTR